MRDAPRLNRNLAGNGLDPNDSSFALSRTKVECNRGYEFWLMKEAVKRNPNITLYGLPWGFAGWLGFGTQNPFANFTATADYIARWVECGRDTHGLNISVLGIWNEAWAPAGRPNTDPWEFALALRSRLDGSGLSGVRLMAPDGGPGMIDTVVDMLGANASYRAATWGLAQHYPGSSPGDTTKWLRAGLPMWSTEDGASYADPTGAGCWARRLVQNVAFGFQASIHYFLISAFATGIVYDGAGFLRAEWPASNHWEITPTLWMTMHWTLFARPGWHIHRCSTGCALAGGGNYAVLGSGANVTIVVETMELEDSQCRLGPDPRSPYQVAPSQNVTVTLPPVVAAARPGQLEVWRSCIDWRYPAVDDGYLVRLAPVSVSPAGAVSFTVNRHCSYTVTTVRGVSKPQITIGAARRPVAFKLPYHEDFEAKRAADGEAPFFGDMMGKWETVPAGGGARAGWASQQQLGAAGAPWPILEPQCNDHSSPLSIIGDLFFEDNRISADVLLEEQGVGAGLALRVRMPESFFRGQVPGLFLYIGAVPGFLAAGARQNPGGVAPPPSKPLQGWVLCADSYCSIELAHGPLPASSPPAALHWHAMSLELTAGLASGSIDGTVVFERVAVSTSPSSPSQCAAETKVIADPNQVIIGFDYRQVTLAGNTSADYRSCVQLCCSDPKCKNWAVARSHQAGCPAGRTCCWLKNGGSLQKRVGGGEDAYGIKADSTEAVPPSGWPGLVATLGRSQVDNFELAGTQASGDAVAPCAAANGAVAAAGDSVVSTPCGYPGAAVEWGGAHGSDSRQLRLVVPHSAVGAAEALCIGATANYSGASLTLVPCGSNSDSLQFVASTGHISPASNAKLCVTAVQKEQNQTTPASLELAECVYSADVNKKGSVQDAQQFQHNPDTGTLRFKGSHCVAAFVDTVLYYRDCCVAIC